MDCVINCVNDIAKFLELFNTRRRRRKYQNCVVYWREGLRCRPNWMHVGHGKPKKGWDFGGKGSGEQWGTKGLVYDQPGTEVDDSYHNWRVPSK